MNGFTKKLIGICENYKNPIQIDQEYNILGVRTWWENGKDLHHFLSNQKNNNISVVPELAVINHIDGRLILFKFKVKEDGIVVF